MLVISALVLLLELAASDAYEYVYTEAYYDNTYRDYTEEPTAYSPGLGLDIGRVRRFEGNTFGTPNSENLAEINVALQKIMPGRQVDFVSDMMHSNSRRSGNSPTLRLYQFNEEISANTELFERVDGKVEEPYISSDVTEMPLTEFSTHAPSKPRRRSTQLRSTTHLPDRFTSRAVDRSLTGIFDRFTSRELRTPFTTPVITEAADESLTTSAFRHFTWQSIMPTTLAEDGPVTLDYQITMTTTDHQKVSFVYDTVQNAQDIEDTPTTEGITTTNYNLITEKLDSGTDRTVREEAYEVMENEDGVTRSVVTKDVVTSAAEQLKVTPKILKIGDVSTDYEDEDTTKIKQSSKASKTKKKTTTTRKKTKRKTKTTTRSTTTTTRRTKKTIKTSTTPRGPRFDIDKFLEIIANLTYDYETNLTQQVNETLIRISAPTCSPPGGTLPDVTFLDYGELGRLNKTITSKCFFCGLTTPGIPRDADCADAFAGDFLPLVPVNPVAKAKIARFRKYCRYGDVYNYVVNETRPRSVFGRFTGGCSVRWTDLSGIYTQRTCRNRKRAITGLHFASKRMAKLEMALSHVEVGCIVSPVATLLPLSRGISLFARFHACVCTGNWCNEAARPPPPARAALAAALLVLWLRP